MLKFSPQNAKTQLLLLIPELQKYLANRRKIYSLDLSAGHSCPGARACLSKVVGGKIVDGKYTEFRCFSASQECMFPNVFKARKHNFDLLRGCRGISQCYNMLRDSLPRNCGILRYHVSGDFFKRAYLMAAIRLAEQRPDILFYGYTKSLAYLPDCDMQDPSIGMVRPNFLLTASYGGRHDDMIAPLNMRYSQVIANPSDCKAIFDNSLERWNGLPIDHDDSHAATVGGSFNLLLHGIQPKGSTASESLKILKGKGTYARI